MTHLLDSNVVIAILKGKADGRRAAGRLAEVPADQVVVCSVVEAELWYGAAKYQVAQRRRDDLRRLLAVHHSLPFDSSCVPHYARIRHALEERGEMIGANDLMIASIALAHDLTLITTTVPNFEECQR
ncbi:MAG TPA: type II toxin-antitoxin system VapC family toxin [Verrucomicrobiales bacterium]|jgi:tRNA(fMet)-specific endonuclease VapC|nr:type II toxin-antitoxin system VapC family toxin [Verrucomicrobiales bacterium]